MRIVVPERKLELVMIRITPKTKRWLKAKASMLGVSMSEIVRQLLEKSMAPRR